MSGETPTERARRMANYLLSKLPDSEQHRLVALAHALGDTWLGPRIVDHDDDDVLAPRDAAALVHATPGHLRSWVRMGVLSRCAEGGYRVRDVYAAQAEVRRRRARASRERST